MYVLCVDLDRKRIWKVVLRWRASNVELGHREAPATDGKTDHQEERVLHAPAQVQALVREW